MLLGQLNRANVLESGRRGDLLSEETQICVNPAESADKFFSFRTCHLSLVTHHWQDSCHENSYLINHNSVRDIHRDFFICTNPVRITDCWHKRGHHCNWPAESAGDDEADDGNVEAE